MKVVITGGTGLIGKRLVEDLARDGHQVSVLSRSPRTHSQTFGTNVKVVQWDGRNPGPWVAELEGTDAVINLAGESIAGEGVLPERWTGAKKKRIRDSRRDAGWALVNAIRAASSKPAVFVQASAVGYYGSTGDTLITESSPAGKDFLASVCVDWEASSKPLEAMGVRRVVARIGLVLAEDGGALPRILLPFRLFTGGWFGSGQQWWPWIHIADTVRALRFMIENEAIAGPVNVTAPKPVRNKSFSQAVGRTLNRPAAVPVPAFAMQLALGEAAATVLEGQRAMPMALQDAGFVYRFSDIDAALNDVAGRAISSAVKQQPTLTNEPA
jgi:uncharacterized protein (TIGR01777 family)